MVGPIFLINFQLNSYILKKFQTFFSNFMPKFFFFNVFSKIFIFYFFYKFDNMSFLF